MNRTFGHAQYSTQLVQNDQEGWVALELCYRLGDKTNTVARVVFWDATGKFSLETVGAELPLEIVEEMITEAKKLIVIS